MTDQKTIALQRIRDAANATDLGNPTVAHIFDLASDALGLDRNRRPTARALMAIECVDCSHSRERHPDGAHCQACRCTEFIWPVKP